MRIRAFPVCTSKDVEALPSPHPSRSMTSDGAVVARPLFKSACKSCGYGFHSAEPTIADRDAMFGEDYDLGLRDPGADDARAEAYADHIEHLLAQHLGPIWRPQSVVEFGAATGALLSYLARRWPLESALGIEPAPRLVTAAQSRVAAPVEIRRGFAEDQVAPDAAFELCISVNVLEHAFDPLGFLATCRRTIKDNGMVLAICPDGEAAGSEILFLDHISSFSIAALEVSGSVAGLRLVRTQTLSGQQTGFRANLFVPTTGEAPGTAVASYAELALRRRRYLHGWSDVETQGVRQLGPRNYVIYGTGEFCDLLRAYAPRIVEGCTNFVTDTPRSAKMDGRPWLSTADFLARSDAVVVAAVHPRNWPSVRERFSAAGVEIVHPYSFSGLLEEME